MIKKKKTPVTKEVIVEVPKVTSKMNTALIRQIVIVLLIGVTAFLIAKKYKGLVIAGTVNQTPISRFELNQKLSDRYGKAIMDEMVSSLLLADLAKKNDIKITAEDTLAERKAIVDRLGGEEALNTALTQYGMSEADFSSRLETVILEKKISEKLFKSEITDSEVEKYFADNKALFTGKTLPEVSVEIKENLRLQGLQQQFSEWFVAEKAKAQINLYI